MLWKPHIHRARGGGERVKGWKSHSAKVTDARWFLCKPHIRRARSGGWEGQRVKSQRAKAIVARLSLCLTFAGLGVGGERVKESKVKEQRPLSLGCLSASHSQGYGSKGQRPKVTDAWRSPESPHSQGYGVGWESKSRKNWQIKSGDAGTIDCFDLAFQYQIKKFIKKNPSQIKNTR